MVTSRMVFIITATVFVWSVAAETGARAEPLLPLGEYERQANLRAADQLIEADHPRKDEIQAARDQLEQSESPMGRSARGGELSPRIVNGVDTAAFPSVGALLHKNAQGVAELHCSGTLVGCNVFLTAAHCIANDTNAQNYQVYLQNGGILELDEIRYPENEYNFPNADVAVLKLKTEVGGIEPSPINDKRRVNPPTEGIIVGFGRSGGFKQDYGIKQVGTVRTSACGANLSDDNLICWKFTRPVGNPGEDSNTCNGDSGGPLFVSSFTGDVMPVAGVTSGGRRQTCYARDHSYDASVFRYRKFIKDNADAKLGPQSQWCSQLGPVGTSRTTFVESVQSDFDENTSEKTFEIFVPPDASTLRVALNGEDDGDGSNDFDLFVLFGEPGTGGKPNCADAKPGQFAFCEFADPPTGEWHIRVKRERGKGKFQVVVTMFD